MTCEKGRTFINLDGRCKMEATEADSSKPHKVSLNCMVCMK